MSDHNGSEMFQFGSPAVPISPEMAEDVLLAASSHLPVIIVGPPDESRALAFALQRPTGDDDVIEVFDCTRPGAVDRLAQLARHESGVLPNHRSAFLLQEVQALASEDQARLSKVLEQLRLPEPSAVRIISSTSVPLYDLVAARAFDEDLYYRLNTIHLIIRPEPRDDDRLPEDAQADA